MTSLGQPWDERWRLLLAAGGAVVGAVIAMGEIDFEVVTSVLLPPVAAAFVAKARWPWLPNLVVGVPALLLPLTVNIVNDTDVEFAMFLLVLATVLIASIERDRRQSTGFAVFSILLIFVLSVTEVLDWSWPNWVAALILSWAFGTAVFHYDRVLEELRATQAELVDQAALVERRRIARDVHDLIGHSLSVVMLHIGGARRLIRSDPDEAEAALLQAEEAGRASMAEVRRTVGLMRDEGEGEGDGVAPAPTLTDIATVVDQYRAAGLPVEYAVSGPIDAVEGPTALACHRIAQEALANVAKHTVGSAVDLSVEVTDTTCHLLVRNQGGGLVNGEPVTGRGHGLTGMRERALSAGGSLLAGPIADGWSVDVIFPLGDGVVVR